MTYEYMYTDGPHQGQIVEVEQKISDPRLETIEVDGVAYCVRRVIAANSPFHLKGGCWARDNYEHGIQSPGKK